MRAFVIVVTQENRLRFRMMKKEHGLLHDKAEKKSYALVRDAYPTNWTGRFSRAYLVQETAAQTVEIEGATYDIYGGTAAVKEPLNMVAKVKLGSRRGEDGAERDVHLTAETIFDRTESVQVRRLGNRRFQWFHALLFVALGVTIGLFAAAAIALMSGGDATSGQRGDVLVLPEERPTPAAVGPPEVLVDDAAPAAPTLHNAAPIHRMHNKPLEGKLRTPVGRRQDTSLARHCSRCATARRPQAMKTIILSTMLLLAVAVGVTPTAAADYCEFPEVSVDEVQACGMYVIDVGQVVAGIVIQEACEIAAGDENCD